MAEQDDVRYIKNPGGRVHQVSADEAERLLQRDGYSESDQAAHDEQETVAPKATAQPAQTPDTTSEENAETTDAAPVAAKTSGVAQTADGKVAEEPGAASNEVDSDKAGVDAEDRPDNADQPAGEAAQGDDGAPETAETGDEPSGDDAPADGDEGAPEQGADDENTQAPAEGDESKGDDKPKSGRLGRVLGRK